jgi:hypothetical protein
MDVALLGHAVHYSQLNVMCTVSAGQSARALETDKGGAGRNALDLRFARRIKNRNYS